MAIFRSKNKTSQERLLDSSSLNTADEIAFAEKLLSRPSTTEPGVATSFQAQSPDKGTDGESSGPQYTHGLEDIYAIETIDVSTVRPMGSGDVAPLRSVEVDEEPHELEQEVEGAVDVDPPIDLTLAEVVESAVQPAVVVAHQRSDVAAADRMASNRDARRSLGATSEATDPVLSLDLGAPFRGWMPSMALDEPIGALGLSPQATGPLGDAGFLVLRDIVQLRKSGATSLQGMGQGHFDEMMQRLDAYLKGRDHDCCRKIDFTGLVRCVLSDVSAKDAHLACDQHGLEHLYPLNASQEMDLRRVSSEQLVARRADAVAKVSEEHHRAVLVEKLAEITEVFVRPWMRGRHGIATRSEVEERVEAVSTDVKDTRQVLRWIQDLFLKENPICSQLCKAAPGLYVSDTNVLEQYRALVVLARSYFYAPHVKYRLDELVARLEREMAVSWDSLPDGFIEKVLTESPTFAVRKGQCGHRKVRLNPWSSQSK